MARIPSAAELGFNDPRTGTPSVQYPTTDPEAAALGVAGQGLQQLGGAALHVADAREEKRQALNEASATTDFVNRLVPLHTQISLANDPEQIAGLRKQYDALLQTSVQAIDDPHRRAIWLSRHSNALLQAQSDADERIAQINRQNYGVGIEKQLDSLIDNAGKSADPKAFDIAKLAGQQLIEAANGYGLNPQWVYERQKQFETKLNAAGSRSRADALANYGLGLGAAPAGNKSDQNAPSGDVGDRVAATLRSRGWPDAAIAGALNNSITESSLNPNATGGAGEKGLFQFHPKTHLPTFQRDYGGDMSPEAQANYIADQVERTMPEYLKISDRREATAQFMRGFERPADQSDAAVSARFANDNASSTILGRLGKDSAAAASTVAILGPGNKFYNLTHDQADQFYKLDDGEKKNQFLEKTATGKEVPESVVLANQDQQPNRTGLPPLMEQYRRIWSTPGFSDAEREHAWSQARARYTAMEADAARSERIATQQQQQIVEDATNRTYADVYSGNPQITAQQIAVDPAFNSNPGRRKQMIELINNPPGSGIPSAQSYNTAQSLIQRIRLPEGDPNKVTDIGQIYDNMNKLNRSDFDFVLKQFNDIRAPGGETLKDVRGQFMRRYEKFITKSNPLAGQGDPAGDARLYEFERFIDQKIEEYRKSGKSPLELFDPRKTDFLGSPEILRDYQPTMEQSAKSIQDFATGTPQPLPPIGTTKTSPEQEKQQQLPGGGVYAPIPPPLPPSQFGTGIRTAPNPFAAPAPRKPDESPENYLRRQGL